MAEASKFSKESKQIINNALTYWKAANDRAAEAFRKQGKTAVAEATAVESDRIAKVILQAQLDL